MPDSLSCSSPTPGKVLFLEKIVYLTNVETFRNVRPHLTQYLLNNPSSKLKAVGIGSTSDIYDIPFWHSYTYSKNELRKELRLFYGNPQTFGRASTLLINVSTVSGEQLSTERPYISREFCLTPEEVVKSSLDCVLDSKTNCIEMTLNNVHKMIIYRKIRMLEYLLSLET